jgi:putative peptidoglycan lipid II flippase
VSLVKKFMTVGGATMASRVLGFSREAMMAAALGAGPVADAFYAAFRFPNLFRRLFAEGAFNAAFVPLFSKEIEANGPDGARRFSEEVFGILFTLLLGLTILMELAMPILVRTIIAPGFSGDKTALTTALAVIMFPYLMCMSLAAMMSGILNSLHKYFAAAIAPVFLNVILIGVLAYALYNGVERRTAGHLMAWGVLVAGVIQLAIVTVAARRAGIAIRLRRPRMTPAVWRLLALALPAAVTGGITQINLVIGQIIASSKPGAISVLPYADRLYQLPLGIIGIAIGTVLLPELSRHLKGGRDKEADAAQSQSLLIAMLLSVPAATALIALATPIVRVLYERGAFSALDSGETARTLIWFAAGLPAYVLIRVLQPGFFAREDTRTPTLLAGISVVINVVISLLLFPSMHHVGIALATSVAAWANAAMLGIGLARRGHFIVAPDQLRRHLLIIAAAIVMAAALWGLALPLAPAFAEDASLLVQIVALGALVALGLVLYFALVHVTGAQPLGPLLRRFGRKP